MRTLRAGDPVGQIVGIVVGVVEEPALLHHQPAVLTEQRPVYQPSGRDRRDFRVDADRLAQMLALVGLGGKSLYSIHFRPWLAISQSADFIAATCSGERISAVATP